LYEWLPIDEVLNKIDVPACDCVKSVLPSKIEAVKRVYPPLFHVALILYESSV